MIRCIYICQGFQWVNNGSCIAHLIDLQISEPVTRRLYVIVVIECKKSLKVRTNEISHT